MNDIQRALKNVKEYLESGYIVTHSQPGEGGRYELHFDYVGNDPKKINTGFISETRHNGTKELYRLIEINSDYFNGLYRFNKVFEGFNKFAEHEMNFIDKNLMGKPFDDEIIPDELKKIGVKI